MQYCSFQPWILGWPPDTSTMEHCFYFGLAASFLSGAINNCPLPMAQLVKNSPVIQETWVWSLIWADPLEKEMPTHSSTLAWRIPWAEEPGGLQFMGSQRVRHSWMTNTHFPKSILGTYWPGELIFQYHIFLPFHTLHGVLAAGILEWFVSPSSSGPCFVRTLHYDLSILGGPAWHGSQLRLVAQAPLPQQGCDPWRRAVVHGVTKIRTWLGNWTTTVRWRHSFPWRKCVCAPV